MRFYKTLGGKIILAVVLTTLVVAVGTRYAISLKTAQEVERYSLAAANEAAQRYANEVQKIVTHSFTTARTLGAALQGATHGGVTSRGALNDIIRTILGSNDVIIGAYGAFEPNALDGRDAYFANTPCHDGSGRFVSYWNRGSGQIACEALIGYDKAGEGDYYVLPTTLNSEVAIEPYNYQLAGKTVLLSTFALPIHTPAGKIMGAVGVDVPLESITKTPGTDQRRRHLDRPPQDGMDRQNHSGNRPRISRRHHGRRQGWQAP